MMETYHQTQFLQCFKIGYTGGKYKQKDKRLLKSEQMCVLFSKIEFLQQGRNYFWNALHTPHTFEPGVLKIPILSGSY